jgi:imidazolonepropionase-like amidohydrolase
MSRKTVLVPTPTFFRSSIPLGAPWLILWISAILIFCMVLSVRSTGTQTMATAGSILLIRNVRVFDPDSGRMNGPTDILISGDRITEIGSLRAPDDALLIDGAGRFAIAGLFDCHTHLSHLTVTSGDSLPRALEGFVSRGILQVRDVGGPLDVMRRLNGRIESGEIAGPDIYYTGPMLEHTPLTWQNLNEQEPGLTVPADTNEQVDSLLAALSSGGARCVKAFGKFDRAVFAHLVERATALGLPVVHDPGPPLFHQVPMDVSIELGVRSIEHAKAPWPIVLRPDLQVEHDSLLARNAGQMEKMPFVMKVAALSVDGISNEKLDALADRMVARRVYLCPTLHVFDVLGEDSTSVPAPMRPVVAAMEKISRHVTARMAARGVSIMVGQDGIDPKATLAEMILLRDCGVPSAEILRGATIHPARFLGMEDRLGSIAPGRLANIVILDKNPLEDIGNVGTVSLVIQHGKVVPSATPRR